jgi:hypothetical protein
MKAAANVANEAIVARVWLRFGKNTVGNTSAAALP